VRDDLDMINKDISKRTLLSEQCNKIICICKNSVMFVFTYIMVSIFYYK